MPFVGKNNLTAKERLYGEAIINQTRREREKAQQEAEERPDGGPVSKWTTPTKALCLPPER